MAKYHDKVHHFSEGSRAWCGRIVTLVLKGTCNIKKVTCSVCVDKYKWDKGELLEWKIGGRFGKNKKRRIKENQYSG